MNPPGNLNPEQQMRNALDSAFAQFPDNTATIEALLPLVSRTMRRQVTARQLEILMNRNPTAYRQNNAGRWSLVDSVYAPPLQEEPETLKEDYRQHQAQLSHIVDQVKPGSYVVFDLETMGDWNGPGQPSDIQLLQVAAQRYVNYQPTGEPFVCFARPSVPIPARITHLTNIHMEDVMGADDAYKVLTRFFTYVADFPLIAHNGAMFDGPVLHTIATRIEYKLPAKCLILDTLPLARALLPLGLPSPIDGVPLENYRLTTLARFYGCEELGAHRADVDISMLGNVIKGLLGELAMLIDDSTQLLHRNPAAYFILKLLHKTADPWFVLCNGSKEQSKEDVDLAE